MVNAEHNADMAIVTQYLPGIVCWGDSMTVGYGGDGVTYPKVLQSLIQENLLDSYDLKSQFNSKHAHLINPVDYEISIPVINMGVGGENTLTILGRNGAVPFVISSPLTIPADETPVEIHFTSEGGQPVAPLIQGDRGLNPVIIGGVEGTLSISQESINSVDHSYHFTRSSVGEPKTIPVGTEIITSASTQYLDYITVIFIGLNGGYSNYDELIRHQRAIIGHQTANSDRFIIVGLSNGTKESRCALEAVLEAEYGKKYINLREYMSTRAMEDAGLEPSEEDLSLMKQGSTPASLTSVGSHYNSVGYELLGRLLFSTMNELGYFDEVRDALTHNFD